MKKLLVNFIAVIIAVAIVQSTIFSVAAAQEGKIPITTSSQKALDYFKQGKSMFDKLRFPDSKGYFEKAVAEDPEFAMGYLYLGQTVPNARGFFDNVEKAKRVMANASEGERWWILGSEAGFVGDPETQHALYSKLVAKYPKDEQAHMLLGNYYFGQQQYDDAIKQYEEAKKINPNFSQIYNQLGYAYRFQKKYDDAEEAFKKYTELIPDDPNPYDSYAEFLMKVGRYDESIQQYRNALKYDPTFAASYTGIAADYNFMGKYDEARAAAQELYDNAVNDGQRRTAHFTKVITYCDEGNLDMAISELEKQMVFAKKIDDAAAMSADLTNIGNLKMAQGKPDEAMAHYTLAMDVVQNSNLSDELKKNNRLGFLFNEAKASIEKGDIAKAKENLAKYQAGAIENNSRFQIWASHQLAGMIALKEKDYKTAVDELRQANQQNMYNLYRLALAYDGMGDKENAMKTCEELVNYNQLNAINYSLVRHKAKKMMASM